MRLHHVAIQVGDLEQARAFYEGVLGFSVARAQPHSLWVMAGEVIVMLERGGANVDDTPWTKEQNGPFCVSFAISPDERSSWKARFAAAGVAIDHESGFTLYVRDPWGARLGFSHYPHPAP